MQDVDFEWDDDKAARNWRYHGISFDMARHAFGDVFAMAWVDNRHGDTEERFNMLDMMETRLLHITYTLRDERVRIISARKAEPHERRRYHDENEA